MVAYKYPECKQISGTSKKSDQGRESTDLVDWVNSVAREEWVGRVLDSKMSRSRSAEGEMLKLLQIALACGEEHIEKRWEMKEAVEKIGERRGGGDADNTSTVHNREGKLLLSGISVA
ncbi:probable LRR receptor-like serine/threonine-protein kinase At4g31250 [Elaeis guineensis]|uniref:probable LRR receptor-like serine/threonine-protein kinase At4g31250 n=1 Tax=Elaeis guineensis var. tenera TaxID=51953 RepID=UPI003C6D283D